jgi:hypothetical protein
VIRFLIPTGRTEQAGRVRYRFTGPIQPKTGRNRINSKFKPNSLVQTVGTGIPDWFDGFPVV